MTPWLTPVVAAWAGVVVVVAVADIAAAAEAGDASVVVAVADRQAAAGHDPLAVRARLVARVRGAAVAVEGDAPISVAIDREVAALVVVQAGEGDRTSAGTGRAVAVLEEIAPVELATVLASVAGIVRASVVAIGLGLAAIVPVAVIVRELAGIARAVEIAPESVAVIALASAVIGPEAATDLESAAAPAVEIVRGSVVVIARAAEIVPELAIAPVEEIDPVSEIVLAAVIGPESEIAPAAGVIVPIGAITITSTTTSP